MNSVGVVLCQILPFVRYGQSQLLADIQRPNIPQTKTFFIAVLVRNIQYIRHVLKLQIMKLLSCFFAIMGVCLQFVSTPYRFFRHSDIKCLRLFFCVLDIWIFVFQTIVKYNLNALCALSVLYNMSLPL